MRSKVNLELQIQPRSIYYFSMGFSFTIEPILRKEDSYMNNQLINNILRMEGLDESNCIKLKELRKSIH